MWSKNSELHEKCLTTAVRSAVNIAYSAFE